ncbi:hypothetical protein [Streptomyces sp. SID3343]|uniref:hypothetical protein n=1 Tax=Streptomyces sp. SID3343 TaxID=2690260 RepID=UPI00136DCCA6|nr:hypothetical protein [Streptomyces sp. SID3343]MYW06720.1 hypothetical protein [Streptomyces sp. SID3343]
MAAPTRPSCAAPSSRDHALDLDLDVLATSMNTTSSSVRAGRNTPPATISSKQRSPRYRPNQPTAFPLPDPARYGAAGPDNDPRQLGGDLVENMVYARGWTAPTAAGSLADHWPRKAPEYADNVTVAGYDTQFVPPQPLIVDR